MKIGDKIVCVDDNWNICWKNPHPCFTSLPVKGKTYIISNINNAKNGEIQIQLVGIQGIKDDPCFYPWRFRLLEEIKQQNKQKNYEKQTKQNQNRKYYQS